MFYTETIILVNIAKEKRKTLFSKCIILKVERQEVIHQII